MKRIIISLLSIVFICINNYSQKYKLDYTGNISGSSITGNEILQFEIINGNATKFWFEVYEAQTASNYHNAQSISNYSANSNIPDVTITRIGPDSYGNYYNKIEKTGSITGLVQREFTYSSTTNVNISNALTYSDAFPVNTEELPAETLDYIVATTNCQSSDAAIISKAEDITLGCSTIQKAVEELAKWIISNITYLSDSGINQDAVSVYNRNSGNCKGQTCLMIAFLRSLDIPARFVSGNLLYKTYTVPGPNGPLTTGASVPGRHAVYEVYYPSQGWVFGDPQNSLHFKNANFIKDAYAKDPNEIPIRYYFQFTGAAKLNQDLESYIINTSIGSIYANLTYHNMTPFGSGEPHTILWAVKELIVPTGIYDVIEIVEPPTGIDNCKSQQLPNNTLMFNLGDDINFSAEFTSYYCDTWVTDIYWKILLYHSGGTYTFISEHYPGSATCYNPSGGCKDGYFWEYTAPTSLPDYEWQFDVYGNILGEVVVEADLNDEDIKSDTEWISLICKKTITNTEITSNTTISGCNIDLIEVIIKNGCTVTCSTDGIIYIKDVTIQDNSTLIIEADTYEVLIEDDFEVESGSILEIE